MSTKAKILKDKKFRFTKDIMVPTRDGRFSILRIRRRLRLKDSMRNSVSISIDHSILSLNFHSTELLRCLVEPIWSLRDGEIMLDNNNSSLMKSPRPSETTTGRTTALISKAMETATT
jgi:hypothetical protein